MIEITKIFTAVMLSVFVLSASVMPTASAAEESTNESEVITKGFVYDDIFSGIVNGNDNTVAAAVTENGLPSIKAVPNHESSVSAIMALDNYGLTKKIGDIDLDKYKYITLIYKYIGDVPTESTVPVIYIASHDGEIQGGAVTSHVRTHEYYNGWRASLLEIPDLTEKYKTPDMQHLLNHIHVNPYGRSLVTSKLSQNAACYIHGIAFHTEKPKEVGVSPEYIEGYPDGTFGVAKYLTRAEACAVAARILGGYEYFEGESSFSDVPNGAWYSQFIAYCESMEALTSFSGNFLPDSYITRAEFSDIIIKLLYKGNSAWTERSAFTGNLNSLADKYITRAEAVSIVDMVFGASDCDVPDAPLDGFSDVTPEHWAYNSIINASVAHTYVINNESSSEWMYYNQVLRIVDESQYLEGEAKLQEISVLESQRISEIRYTDTNVTVSGKSYYVSASGNDNNSGLSDELPIKTIEAVNSLDLKPGDAVFFERGSTFRGSLIAASGVTYSAYGYGEKPILTASPANFANASNWEATDTANVWKLTTPIKHDVGLVVFNDGETWSQKRIKGRSDFAEGGLENLDVDLAMWHDVSAPTNVEGYVYLRSDSGNPGKRFYSIELSPRNHIIKAADDIIIDNLCFKYTGAHAVSSGDVKNLVVQNCEFGFIGGSWFRTDTLSRFGNAVEVYGACDGYVVDNCYMYHVYDAGMTHQLTDSPERECVMKNIKYTNNVVTDTSYPIEYFIGQANEGINHKMENVDISGNIILRTGYGFGDQRPDKTAASHIKGWDAYNEAYNFTITDNIFGTSKYRMMHLGAVEPEWIPIFKGNTYIQNAYSDFGNIGIGLYSEYDAYIEDYIAEHSGDSEASVYFLRPSEE